MGHCVGPAPEIPDDLAAYIARMKAMAKEARMSRQNPNRQTPRPIVVPRSRIPRAQIIDVEWNGLLVRGTVAELERAGYITQESKSATGPTTRLACPVCGDVPPTGARYCIECGATL